MNYEWIFVQHYGKTYVAPKQYPDWAFKFCKANEKHPDYWVFIPSLNVWRCNISVDF